MKWDFVLSLLVRNNADTILCKKDHMGDAHEFAFLRISNIMRK